MTVSYSGEVPNGSSFGCFWKILWKWRGSVYKLVWRELIAYLCLYYTINLVYRFVLNDYQQQIFAKIRVYFGEQSETIPMSFVLGFYVSLVVKRWWEQYRLLPWPDTLALFISAAIPNSNGGNETGRLMRRNIMRYMVLAYVITLQRISLRVKRRFPSTQHLVDAGLMHESEMKIFETMNAKSPMSKYWMPLVWATNIINRARKDGLISSDHIVQTILVELSDIRRRLGGLIGYDTVCVPLVYTQVVTLVLYIYFIAAVVGKQMLPNMPSRNGKADTDLYFPLFTVLQFVFYVGWLKVAEVLINPFGEDDDDIELNWLIDRHIKASYMIVDEMHEEHPELLRDQYWECVVPKDLPYTVASEHYRRNEPKGSAEKYKVKTADAMYANIMPTKRNMTDDVYADYESVDTPMVERRKNNWLTRQLSRMGSMRSQSTAYSSGGTAFNRNRLNSVYSSPESGLPLAILQQQQQHQQLQSKPSLYEKFVHRKSLRVQKQLNKQNSRLNVNGLNVAVPKNRPRIPTPDVTKEGVEKENKLIFPTGTSTSGASGVELMASHLASSHNMYPYTSGQDGQVLGTLLLSPIKEMDSCSSNNTLIPGHPATAALAQAVLPKNLQDVNFGTVSLSPSNLPVTTLSFPFTVTTSTSDSMPSGTLNIVSMPQITTSNSNEMMSTIPLALTIPRSVSAVSVSETAQNPSNNRFLTVKNENNTPISRTSSFNDAFIRDSYVLERKLSQRSLNHQMENRNNSSNPHIAINSNEISSSNNNSLMPNSVNENNSTSAPTTLTKGGTPEAKNGEVYV
ncbi:bestrophin homolog 15 isoform X1 [Episyrphus balteatus]|uniref:bestrophin homolog 15 isoform X1 n=1 Tax=Episyrphus balteatus TaxID=286459 RepID=UPI00248637B6|nr:bestrophin homolog 15 isoform X1 [Episyrphus balteatus]XP_055841852.1 bestrophin homolog 15 isoform X1 [Episyrphus balteatus]XP_055841853.1 bestrophin homolog 15 isoform X1 [Episyrphus balteatus]